MFTLNCKGKLVSFEVPVVMGIINITPDSFYAESRYNTIEQILRQAEKMKADGALMLDVGGQSTRPGSERLDAAAETRRVIPVIESLSFNFPELIISIDTYFSDVARAAVRAGASMVNDISGGKFDKEMLPLVAAMRVPFVCTHVAAATPETMHHVPVYENVTTAVVDFLSSQTYLCKKAGIHDLIIDPGIGFSKSIENNFEILQNLEVFKILDMPLLLGVSRKGTVYRTLGTSAAEALNGSTVLHTVGLMKGASILRVHDVREAKEAIVLTEKLKSRNN
jgi:dihydropteroate synthase